MESKKYDSKSLVKLIKISYNPPNVPYDYSKLEKEQQAVMLKVNNATFLFLRISYLFKAFDYSLNLLYKGNKTIKSPNTKLGLDAMVSLYKDYLNPDIITDLYKIVLFKRYKEIKDISNIPPEMYILIIRNIDYSMVESDFNEILKLFKDYFCNVLKVIK